MESLEELEMLIENLPTSDPKRKKVMRQRRRIVNEQIKTIEEQRIQEGTPKERMRSLTQGFIARGLRKKLMKKDVYITSLNISGKIILEKYINRFEQSPKYFCFLKDKVGNRLRYYVLLGYVN